ncbi:uracil-DNA glycosylase [Microbacterium sp. NPDC096154]|uniref:uracil-DNA glycosylase n=1 Tax=Microbacterium sp. NPDC096154 TaxID=3155549 RepID=UPI003323DC46
MLGSEPAVQPLTEWSRRLEAMSPGKVVPHIDPADAGVDARVLFVLEAPGPMTNASNIRPGSGFISVDNDDATAANIWQARSDAGLHSGCMLWNIVPWYLGPASVKPTKSELGEGAASLLELMGLLPKLTTVILAGRIAQQGWRAHIASSLRHPPVDVIETWHPSPLAMNQPGKRDQFAAALASAPRSA